MSIILKALKKIQEQEAGGQSAPLPGDIAQGNSAGGTSVEPGRAASFSSAERQSFGLAPKALIGLLAVLAICTTGWFASKIYLNVKLAARASAPAVAPKASAVSAEAPVASGEAPVLAVASLDPSPPSAPPEKAQASGASATPDASPVPQEPEIVPAETPEPSQPVKVAPRPAAPVEPLQSEVIPESVTPIIESTIVEVSAVDISGMKRSPGVPVQKVPEKKGRPEFKINAIAWQNEEPRAIVNMQSIYEGDVIEGATVVAIKRKLVIFEYEGETFKVRF